MYHHNAHFPDEKTAAQLRGGADTGIQVGRAQGLDSEHAGLLCHPQSGNVGPA